MDDDEIRRLERERIDAIRREADAIDRNTVAIGEASRRDATAKREAAETYARAEREKTSAMIASQAALTRTYENGFWGVSNKIGHMTANISSQLQHMSASISSQVGYMTDAVSSGFSNVTYNIKRLSDDVCNRLDEIRDLASNPLSTQAREHRRRATERYGKGLFEEALKETKVAVEKDDIDYISWFLLGNLYLHGKNEFGDVTDLDEAIKALATAAKCINHDANTNDTAKPMAAEIWFYLGLSKYNKRNKLHSKGEDAEAKTVLEGALQAFERSWGYSKNMLQARYNAARCKALIGDVEGALGDLEAVTIRDRNYCLNVLGDGDFDSMRDEYRQLIERLKRGVFVEVEEKYKRVNILVGELNSLGGCFEEIVPTGLSEFLPYFDLLDYNIEFRDMIPRIERLIWEREEQIERERRAEQERLEAEGHAEQERKERVRRAEQDRLEAKRRAEQEQKEREYRAEQERMEVERQRAEQELRKKIKKHCGCISSGWAYAHTVGLKTDGTVVAVGSNRFFHDFGQCNVSGWHCIVAASSGWVHTVGLKADGTVVAVGHNGDGRCNVREWRDIVAVSSGWGHTVGLKTDGTVVAVGSNEYDQCNVSGWYDIVAVSSGWEHTVGLKTNGTVVAVGHNGDGRCNVSGWRDIVAVSSGWGHTVGLKTSGTVVAVGHNGDGQRHPVNPFQKLVAAHYNGGGQCNVSGWHDIVAVFSGWGHTVGLKADGTVVTVGSNKYGQCNVTGWRNIGSLDKDEVRKSQKNWKEQGLCHYCGGRIGGLFTKKCKSCGNIH